MVRLNGAVADEGLPAKGHYSMTEVTAHRILCNSALTLCHLVRGPKIQVLESLCWPAKAWCWKLRIVALPLRQDALGILMSHSSQVLQELPILGSTLQQGLQLSPNHKPLRAAGSALPTLASTPYAAQSW